MSIVFMLAMLGGALYITALSIYQSALLEQHGKFTHAVITYHSKDIQEDDFDRLANVQRIGYAYKGEDGLVYHGETVIGNHGKSLKVGDSISVSYCPWQPEMHESFPKIEYYRCNIAERVEVGQ